MKILVTGGAGFIASHIVDAYLKLGHQVAIIDDLSSGRAEFINSRAVFYKGDVRDKNLVEKIIRKEQPQIINHHAAQISVRISAQNPELDADINLIGLLNITEAARKIKIKKFIFASSGGVVYGEATKIPTPENYHPLLPLSPYGVTKLASELYLNYYYQNYKIPYVALRYSNVYGPRQNPHGEAGVVAIFSQKLLKRQKPTINGYGLQTRDYVYVGDIVRANISALDDTVIGSFNIGTGKETNVVEIYKYLRRIIGVDVEPVFGPAKSGEQKRSCLDVKMAHRTFGWKAEIKLEDGLKLTVDYFRKYA